MKMMNQSVRRREPISDTHLLLTITICIFFVMYLAAMQLFGGGFLRAQQIFDILNDNASLIIIACGLTVVMIGGGIDISVGGVIAMTVMACVVTLNATGNVFLTLALALGIGLAFGCVQGFLVSYLGIQPFIVSLAGMFFARGMTTIISVEPQKVLHDGFNAFTSGRIEIPWLGYYVEKTGKTVPARMEYGVVIALIVLVLIFLMLRYTRLGRGIYAVGGNQQSALMLGINVKRTRFTTYLISGLLAGIAGFVFMMHTRAGNATNATAFEMDAIAASIIGGTLLSGGVGNVFGTFFGVLTLATIKKIVPASGLREPYWQDITTGAMLCFFILLQSVVLAIRGKNGKKTSVAKG